MIEYLKIGSLFAGIGGLDLGLERARSLTGQTQFQCAWQVENDDYATRVLAKHWPNVRRWGDVCTFLTDDHGDTLRDKPGRRNGESRTSSGEPSNNGELWYVDIIAAGWPCQDISFAGRGDGLDGERSGLFFEVVRVVRQLRPKYILLENVAALLNRGLDRVLGELAAIGYDAEWHCIPAASVGAPHIRDRVFICAYTRLQHGNRGQSHQPETRHGYGHRCEDGEETTDNASGCSQEADAANTSVNGRIESTEILQRRESIVAVPGGDGQQLPRPGCEQAAEHWAVEPTICELVDGVSGRLVRYAGRTSRGTPNRVAKLRCLGNAVVPQVAQYVGEMILNHHEQIDLHNSPQTCDD